MSGAGFTREFTAASGLGIPPIAPRRNHVPEAPMKLDWILATFLIAGCSDKGDDSQGGGDDSGSVDDSDTPPPAEDADNDGYDVNEDCNDGDPAVNPGATEVCDGVDNDCDKGVDFDATDATAYYADADADGYGAGAATMSCDPVKGSVTETG